MQSAMLSTLLKVLSIPLISLFLSACGGGGSTVVVTAEELSDYNGNWQSACSYDNNTGLSSIDTVYISGTDYTIYIDEFDNTNCFGSSDYTTEIEGYLYFGDYRPYVSNYCENTIEVDFTAAAIYEDGIKIPSSEISFYLDLPSNTQPRFFIQNKPSGKFNQSIAVSKKISKLGQKNGQSKVSRRPNTSKG